LTTSLVTVKAAASGVELGSGVGGTGVSVGAAAVGGSAVGARVATLAGTGVAIGAVVGSTEVLVKVGRKVFVGTGVPAGPRALCPAEQPARATANSITPIAIPIRKRMVSLPP